MPQRAEPPADDNAVPTVHMRPGESAIKSTDFELTTEAPETFGDYELLEEIGAGGMGRVYKARQKSLGRIVALKTLRSRRLADPALAQRLHKEAEAAAQLDHPGIVPVYASGAEDGQFFFTMALVEGSGLDDRLRKGPLDNRMAARVVQQVAEAVAYAHRKGVVHRDLKPANILLDRAGGVKITDFGIARRLNVKDLDEIEPTIRAQNPEVVGTLFRLTQEGTVLGTPGFMSPEQSRASGRTGPSVDVWALGAILYACLTGRPPFLGATALETLALTVDTEPVPPNEINPDADPELAEICLKCLRKDVSERYPSAEAVAAELAHWREGKAVRSTWTMWRNKVTRYLDGMPELMPLITGLAVHRFGNVQEGLLTGSVIAGIILAARRKHALVFLAPVFVNVLFLFCFPAVRWLPDASPWLAGALVSGVGLMIGLTTLACGWAALGGRWTVHRVMIIFLVVTLFLLAAAVVAGGANEHMAGSSGQIASDAGRFFQRAGGWFLVVPLGLAVGAILGQLNHRLDRFGEEPLPAFAAGAAVIAILATYAIQGFRPQLAPETSRFAILGPGPALSMTEYRAGNWMGTANSPAPAAVRQTAAVGIFWLKVLVLIAPMALSGIATSLVTRLVFGRSR